MTATAFNDLLHFFPLKQHIDEFGGFLKFGSPPLSSIYRWDFYKLSSYWDGPHGIPWLRKPPFGDPGFVPPQVEEVQHSEPENWEELGDDEPSATWHGMVCRDGGPRNRNEATSIWIQHDSTIQQMGT